MSTSASFSWNMPRRALHVAAWGLLALSAMTASALPLTFGSRTLQVPEPAGFKAVGQSAPAFTQMAAAYLPPTNRLAEVYVQPDAAAALASGQPAKLDRYFQLQVLRKIDGVVVSPNDFASAKGQIETGVQDAMRDASNSVNQLAENGNAAVARTTSNDPKLSMSGLSYLGFFRQEPWGLFFTIKMHVASAASQQGQDMVGACAFVMVNYQALYLYSYATYHGEDDRRWAEQAVSTWVDAVRAANPDDTSLESQAVSLRGGFDWNEVMKKGLIGAVIGGLIGLVGLAMKKRKN